MAPSRLEGSELYFRGSHFIHGTDKLCYVSLPRFARPRGSERTPPQPINVTKAFQNYKYFDEYLTLLSK